MEDNKMEEITLAVVLKYLNLFREYFISKWIFIVIAVIAGAALGLGYSFIQTNKYTASCTFILEEKSAGGGSLAGLASQFGLEIGGTTGNNLFAGDNLLEIIPSRNIVNKVLLSRVDSTSEQTLADLFLDFMNLKKNWASKERLANIGFSNIKYPEQMTLIQDSVLGVIYKTVIKSCLTVDWARKKTSLIRIVVTSKNEKFSKYFTERVVEESKKLYINIKTGTSQANVARLQLRADSLLALLNNKSYQAAEVQVLNPNPAMKQALVPTEITMRDKTVIGTVYTEVVKNLETSKILLSQQTPVIQILDAPSFPLVRERFGKFLLMTMGGFIGLFVLLIHYALKFGKSKPVIE